MSALEILGRTPPSDAPPDRPPVVLVHGAWHAAWCWESWADRLAAAGYEVHAPSLRGHGASPGRERLNRLRLRDYAEDVASVVASLAAPPVLVGHSMGGAVVQHVAASEGGPALAGLALLASIPPRGAIGATLSLLRRHPLPFLAANATLDLGRLVATPALVRDHFFTPDASEEVVRHCTEHLQSESYLAFLDLLALDRPRGRPGTLPVLVLAGDADRIFSVADARATGAAWGTAARIVEGLAHDVMLDSGEERAYDVLSAWLHGLSTS